MGKSLLLCALVGSVAACLDAPTRGDDAPVGGADAGDPVQPPGDGDGGDDPADDLPAPPLVCGAAGSVDVVYPSALRVSVGESSVGLGGILLLVNTESDLFSVEELSLAASAERASASVTATLDGDGQLIGSGEAQGHLSIGEEVLLEKVPEPWTDSGRPAAALDLDYDEPEPTTFIVTLTLTVGAARVALPMDIVVEGFGVTEVLDAARLPLACAPE